MILLTSACSGTTDSDGTNSDGQIELTMMNHSRGEEAALNALAATYEKETGVKVTVDTPGPADYVAKLQAKAQSKQMPDLFTAVGPADMAPFYKAGWAMNLTDEFAAAGWGDSFVPAVVKMSTWKDGNALGVPPGVYAAYWEIATYGVFVNPAISGIDPASPPATTGDMIHQLSAAGSHFSVAGSLTPSLVQSYASNWMTDEEINATFGGEASWETDAWRKTFALFTQLKDGGVLANNSIPGGSNDNASVEKSFFNVRDLGALFDGSWATGVATATAPDFTDYGAMPWPAADDGTLAPRSPGIAGRGAAVNAKGKHTGEALAFLKWLTAADQQKVLMDKAGLIPSNTELLASPAVPKQVQGFADKIADVQVIPNQLTSDVIDAINRGVQSLVLGEVTVDEVLASVQAAQGRR